MTPLFGYLAGANLGHWISQYGKQGKEHWDTYIRERDFARMAEWGLDHVRLPVDYMLFESDDEPGVYRESGLAYIDNTLAHCKKYGLNLILDLHHAPGFIFSNGAANDLFTSKEKRERFFAIWEMFAKRYAGEGDNLIFELLNELVWDTSDPWNDLWQEAVARIGAISPRRRIIVGGNYWNSVNELKNLALTDNDRVIYNFHFYHPFLFTHQRAPWTEERHFKPHVPYPVPKEIVEARYHGNLPQDVTEGPLDRAFLEKIMQPVFDFIEKTGKTVYCGEYGVISYADKESAARWLNDLSDILIAHGIGRAVWSYRGFAAITTRHNRRFDKTLVAAISKKN